jgi:hypothetical protein
VALWDLAIILHGVQVRERGREGRRERDIFAFQFAQIGVSLGHAVCCDFGNLVFSVLLLRLSKKSENRKASIKNKTQKIKSLT